MTIEGRHAPEEEAVFDQVMSELKARVLDSQLYRDMQIKAVIEGKYHVEPDFSVLTFGDKQSMWTVITYGGDEVVGASLAKIDIATQRLVGFDIARTEEGIKFEFGERTQEDEDRERAMWDELSQEELEDGKAPERQGIYIATPDVALARARELFAEFEAYQPLNPTIRRYESC